MTFREKSTLINLTGVLLVALGYAAVVLPRSWGTPVDDIVYQPVLVIAVVLQAILIAVGHVLIAVVKPAEAVAAPDERERLIEWRGQTVGGYVLAVGVFFAICLAMVETHWFWIANLLAGMWVLAEVVAGAVKLVLFRRGV